MTNNWRCPECGAVNPESRGECQGCDYQLKRGEGYSELSLGPQVHLEQAGAYVGTGFWIRALARVIDLIVHNAVGFTTILLVSIIAGVVAALTGVSPEWLAQKLEGTTLISIVLALVGYTIYHTLCEGLHGATLGKLICGLVVVKEDGSPCGLGAALGRSLAFFIDQLIFGLAAASSISSSPQRQRLGDKWVHTLVVKRRDLQPTQLRSGCRFAVVFVGAVILDGSIFGLSQLLKLVG
jgi:uncharacterized RDD family membrane protein YckC